MHYFLIVGLDWSWVDHEVSWIVLVLIDELLVMLNFVTHEVCIHLMNAFSLIIDCGNYISRLILFRFIMVSSLENLVCTYGILTPKIENQIR